MRKVSRRDSDKQEDRCIYKQATLEKLSLLRESTESDDRDRAFGISPVRQSATGSRYRGREAALDVRRGRIVDGTRECAFIKRQPVN